MAKRNARGQFVKSGGKTRKSKSVAISRRSGGAVVVVGNRAPARRRSSSPARRSSSLLSARGIASYLGGVRGDDVAASAGLGLAVNKARATVETVVNYAPDFVAPLGGYGIIALGAGLLSHFGYGRKLTSPIARAATIIATNKITTKGGLFAAKTDSLSGDDDDGMAGDDDMDVGALEALEGDDDVSGDDGGMAGDDGEALEDG